jgi:hypothetical protein
LTPKRAPLLLLQLLLTAFPDDPAGFRNLCGRIEHWNPLFDAAERHGVAGLLHRALKQSGYSPPGEHAQVIDRRVAAGRLLQRHLQRGMTQVLKAFSVAGLGAVALKGPILAERLYGDAVLRHSSDVDILVGYNEFDAASALLESLGYQQRSGPAGRYERTHMQNVTFCHAELPMVELHFHLLVEFGVTIDAGDCLKRVQPYRGNDGATCYILSLEDEVLYLCLHAIHHEFARLCWLVDIWALLRLNPAIDWEVVFQRAREMSVRQAFGYTVEVLHRRLRIDSVGQLRLGRPMTMVREGFVSTLLRIYEAVSPYAAWNGLASICFKAALCDRPLDFLGFLGHQLSRNTKRRIHRLLPRLLPGEWSG